MNKIYVVGIGPGEYEQMTVKASRILSQCDIIIGYNVYVDLVKEHFADKEFITTPMRQEEKRCKIALEKAASGKTVAVICSGDAGVYGMTGLIYELSHHYPEVEIETVCGVSAVISGAGILGAPLIHDFAVISLSDLLTPWEKIEKRLLCAAESDMVICLYNPSSMKRKDYLKKACLLVSKYKSPKTVCGIARNIGREGQSAQVLTLEELTETEVDMFSTVFIGNMQTKEINGKMVTPRGYRHE